MNNAEDSSDCLKEMPLSLSLYEIDARVRKIEKEVAAFEKYQDGYISLRRPRSSPSVRYAFHETSPYLGAFQEPGESDAALGIRHRKLKERIQKLKDKRKEEFHQLNNLESKAATAYYGSSQDSSDISQISTSSAQIFSSQSSASSERDVGSFNGPYQGYLNSWEEQATEQAINLHPERNALLYSAREWLSNSNTYLETGDSALLTSSQGSTDTPYDTDGFSTKIPICVMKQSALDMPSEDKERLRRELKEIIARAIPKHGNEDSCWICETSKAEEKAQTVTRWFHWTDRRFPLVRQGRHLQQQVGTLWIIVEGTMSPSQKYGWTFESWHLSHLCGNWRCVNPAHHTIEPGSDNQDRKHCHDGNRPHHACKHKPRCRMNFKNGKPKGITPLSSAETPSKKHFQSTLTSTDGLMRITNRQPSTTFADLAKMGKKRKAFGKDSTRYMKQKKINFN